MSIYLLKITSTILSDFITQSEYLNREINCESTNRFYNIIKSVESSSFSGVKHK